jgi:hypothetical protein
MFSLAPVSLEGSRPPNKHFSQGDPEDPGLTTIAATEWYCDG